MIALNITVKLPDVAGLIPDDLREASNKVAAVRVADLARSNFIDRSRRVNSRRYWAQAADSVQVEPGSGSASCVAIYHVGVGLHYRGGTVRPSGRTSEVTGRPIKSLLIPFPDSLLAKRGATLAEAALPEDEIHVLKAESGRPYLAWIRPPQGKTARSKSKVFPLGLFVRETHHDADPSVLPAQEAMDAAAQQAAREVINNKLQQP